MWCVLCIKHKTKKCPKKIVPRNTTRSCPQFVMNTRKVRASTLQKAIKLSKMPTTQLRALMALLDSDIKLRRQQLSIALTIPYDVIPGADKVYLISSPKKDDYAYGVAFTDIPKKNTIVSVTVEKEKYYKARDIKLKKLWERLERKFITVNDPDVKRNVLLKVFKVLGRDYVKGMLRFNGIDIDVHGRKISDIVDELLKSYL